MTATNRCIKKVIAYLMIGLLTVNLLSGSVQSNIVNAETGSQTVLISGVDNFYSYKENSKVITYSFNGTFSEETKYWYSIKKNGVLVEEKELGSGMAYRTGDVTVNNDGDKNQYEVTFKSMENGKVVAQDFVSFQLGLTELEYSITANERYANDEVIITYKANYCTDYKMYRKVEKNGETIDDALVDFKTKNNDIDNPYLYVTEEKFLMQTDTDAGDYKVTTYLKNSTNDELEGRKIVEFSLDKTAPKVTVTSTASSKKNFEDSVKYTILVEELNYESCNVVINVTQKTLNGSNQTLSSAYIPKSTEDTKEISFDKDGTYEIYVTAADGAENTVTTEKTTFKIDHSKPKLSLSGVQDGKHYNKTMTAEFESVDLNPNTKGYIVKVSKNNKDFIQQGLEWDSKVEFHNTASLNFEEEGAYRVTFEGKDEAGNVGEMQTVEFVIDKTEPEIAKNEIKVSYLHGNKEPVFYEEEQKYYLSDDAKLDFQVVEQNYLYAKIFVNAKRDFRLESVDKNQTLEMKSNPEDLFVSYTEEGEYYTEIHGEDKAGNIGTIVSKDFVVDKTAPVFYIEGVNKNIKDTFGTSYKEGKELTFFAKDDNHKVSTYKISVKRTDKTGSVSITDQSQAVVWRGVSDSDKMMSRLKFEEEGNYIVTITGEDKAGNIGNIDEVRFRIDQTTPVVTLSSISKNSFYNETAVLDVLINEYNYVDTTANIVVKRVLDGKIYEETTQIALTDVYTTSRFSYQKEGVYDIYVEASDAAGNKAEQKRVHFTIDTEKPQVKISGIQDKDMTKKMVSLTYSVEDRNHDFKKYVITGTRSDRFGNEESFKDIFEAEEWSQIGYLAKKELSYNEEGKYEITFDAVDLAGNVADTESITFYIDHTAPVISNVTYADATSPIAAKYHNIYSNQAIMVEFQVVDQVVGVKDSKVYVTVGSKADRNAETKMYIAHKGVGNYYYVYVPTDLKVSEFDETLTFWANDLLDNESSLLSTNIIYNTDKPRISMDCDVDYNAWTNQDVTFHTNVTDEKSGLKEVTYTINGKVVKKVNFTELVNSYDYELTAKETASKVSGYSVVVEVTNNCGTSNTMSRQVYIDKVKPKVTLSGTEQGKHYNDSQIFSTAVQEVSYKNTQTIYYITRTLDGKTYNMSSAVFKSDKYEDTTNRKMSKEGLYHIYAVTTDSAGNSSKSNTLSFVIDKTAPKVSVSGTSESSMNGSTITLDFKCIESFYATNEIDINVERTLDGNTVTQTIENFPKKAKRESISHTFSEDGTYKVTISATDKAGNIATPQTISFSVDTTKPELQITGTSNYEQWDKPATVQFTVEESYYSNNEVTITGTKTDIDGNVSDVTIPKFANSGKISNLSQTFSEDGNYDLEIVSKDEAGNKESSNIHFTIDQTNPQIKHVEEYNGGYYQSFKLADTLEDVFKDLTVINYRMLLNGVEYNGVDEITDEGKYNLYVEVADELGHETVKNVEFIIDHTAPKVIFSGVKDGEDVHESGVVYLALTNTDDLITSIRMNGVEYDSKIRSLPFTEYGSYKIDVDCTDKAGNEVTRSVYFVYNNPLTLAMAVGGVSFLIVGTCIWLWIRTKRKEEEEKKI